MSAENIKIMPRLPSHPRRLSGGCRVGGRSIRALRLSTSQHHMRAPHFTKVRCDLTGHPARRDIAWVDGSASFLGEGCRT